MKFKFESGRSKHSEICDGVSIRANKVKSVMGVSTQARSPMEVGTEMRSVMYAAPEKRKPCLKVASEIFSCNGSIY